MGHIVVMHFPRSTSLIALTAILSLASVLASGCAADAAGTGRGEAPTAESAQSAAGRIGSHGMVLAGDASSAFISHIPMFAAPHDVQLVVHGTMTAPPGKPLPATFSDRPYTFLPERTSLDALRNGVTRELQGTIYLGNFEQGGRPVVSNVRFAVADVVHQHILLAGAPASQLGYVVFGTRAHPFAAHLIGAAPSFDEVLAVTLADDAPSDADLAHGVIAYATGTVDDRSSRLGAHAASLTLTDGTHPFVVRPGTLLSCLTGPDFDGPCFESGAQN